VARLRSHSLPGAILWSARACSRKPKTQMTQMKTKLWFLFALLLSSVHFTEAADIERSFATPPNSARPWVYWFWLSGNITSNGITADLQAMKRVGIGGVLIMEVDQGAPNGPAAFMGQNWRALFHHAVKEAERLGLQLNMNNDAGWNGSGGPWIKPEESMQKVVWSETTVDGPKQFAGPLAQPKATAGFYRDIAVQAFPTSGSFRIDQIKAKAGYEVGGVGAAVPTNLPPEMIINLAQVIDLSNKVGADGRLAWEVPPGQWTVLRFGHASTGVENAPAPASGRGLECDKLSKKGIEANFAGMMAKLIADSGKSAGGTLVATHIDSWENGSQNWTAEMRDEFRRRRGYDMTPFLPVFTGRVVGSLEISERFLWDLRQTISDLVVENYAGHMRELANQRGLKLSIEAYGGPCDDLPYAGRADEPMCEFWMGGGAFQTCKEMASAAHIYGKPILGAEAFTAADQERWLEHPGSIKSLGDRAFCDGINRFVFHRYALQPWENRNPGMTMGPWGLHYERTQTWWDWSKPWHEYLARCQFMLRQGLFVADICYLQPEASPQASANHPRLGYDYDNCSAEVLMTRMSVKDGRLVLPDGMSYRVLVLHERTPMTPELLAKIRDLVRDGATVIGARPVKSPSLRNFPACDAEVQRISSEVWADCDGGAVKSRQFGKGKVACGISPEKFLTESGVPTDFTSSARLNYIHRSTGSAEIYFVANPQNYSITSETTFRVSGQRPEFWWPETGRIEPAAVYRDDGSRTTVCLALSPSESVFVLFRKSSKGADAIVTMSSNGKQLFPSTEPAPRIQVEKAVYGILNDPKRTRNVAAKVQKLIDAGETSFQVARLAEGDDPAYLVVKTAMIDYLVGGQRLTATGTDPDNISFARPAAASGIPKARFNKSKLSVECDQPCRIEMKTATGKTRTAEVSATAQPYEMNGPWEIEFPAKSGAPANMTTEKLGSWTESGIDGVKYFSGAATYRKAFALPSGFRAKDQRLLLDLGRVEVMAQVKLNGRDLGILWKAPYTVDVTAAVHPGQNSLEIKVVNLWVNRMIGDEELPEDSARNPNGTLKQWPDWLEQNGPSPSGRFTFTSWRLWKKGAPLQPSGLLGPVRIRPVQEAQVR